MKRHISTFLVLILCFCAWAEPVKAADLENGSLINVLDFATANDSGLNRVSAASNSSVATAVYSMPDKYIMRYVDMIVNSASGNLISCLVNGTTLRMEKIQNRLWRVYGELDSSAVTLNITFNADNNGTAFFILALNASTYNSLSYDIEGYCSILASGWQGTDIHFVPTDDINHRTFTGDPDPYNSGLTLFLWTDDWRKYDYIDFQLNLHIYSINSVTAVMGNTVVPLDVCYLDPPSFIANDYYVTFRMYTGGLDKTSEDYPMIILDGSVIGDHVNLVGVMNITGHLDVDNVDPLTYWLYRLNGGLNSGFSNLNSFLAGQFSAQQTLDQQLNENLIVTINSNFLSLSTWISNQTFQMEQSFSALGTLIQTKINDVRNDLTAHFTSLEDSILEMTETLVAAIKGDASVGDDFQQDVDEKDQELDDMATVMDSVIRPDIDDINLGVSDHGVYQSAIASVTSPFLVFLTGDIFGNIAFMVIMLSTVGYALFGKR